MNFYPFHTGDYMLRTAHLEPLEDLAYRRLIDLYYVNECPISGTAEELARVIRMRSNSAEVESVLKEFFAAEGNVWRHAHCDEVIAKYQEKARVAAENGKRGGRPRKADGSPDGGNDEPEGKRKEANGNQDETQSVSSAKQEETGSKTNQEPVTNNQREEHVDAHASTPAVQDDQQAGQILQMDRIPYENIRLLYNQILGGKLKRCMGLTDSHRKHIRAAYNLKLDGQFPVRDGGLDFWEGLFHDVLDCPFMLGVNNRSWRADFEFLTTASKIQRFMEGKYDAA
ncbi:YdaU family protein [Pseudomonas mendocina]|nr:YdaU family protein [Pseudomonas mendocina]MDV5861373.1 YdaU family protein [Pseudomonas mendocina]